MSLRSVEPSVAMLSARRLPNTRAVMKPSAACADRMMRLPVLTSSMLPAPVSCRLSISATLVASTMPASATALSLLPMTWP